MPIVAILTIKTTENTRNQRLSTYFVRRVAKQRNVILEPMQPTHRLLGIDDQRDGARINDEIHRTMEGKYPRCSPNFNLTSALRHSGNAVDSPETVKTTKLPTIPEVIWQQPLETSVNHNKFDIIINHAAIETSQRNQRLKNMQLIYVASQTFQPEGHQPQIFGPVTLQFRRNRFRNRLVPFPNGPNSCQNDIQETDTQKMVTLNGDNNIPPLKITTAHKKGW